VPQSAGSPQAFEQQAVDAIWQLESARVQRGILGLENKYNGSLEGFDDAVVFFEQLTGIQSDTLGYAGRLPTPHLATTYEAWQNWYVANRTHLRLNSHGALLLKSPQKTPP
jgi:hypothetical protein